MSQILVLPWCYHTVETAMLLHTNNQVAVWLFIMRLMCPARFDSDIQATQSTPCHDATISKTWGNTNIHKVRTFVNPLLVIVHCGLPSVAIVANYAAKSLIFIADPITVFQCATLKT